MLNQLPNQTNPELIWSNLLGEATQLRFQTSNSFFNRPKYGSGDDPKLAIWAPVKRNFQADHQVGITSKIQRTTANQAKLHLCTRHAVPIALSPALNLKEHTSELTLAFLVCCNFLAGNGRMTTRWTASRIDTLQDFMPARCWKTIPLLTYAVQKLY